MYEDEDHVKELKQETAHVLRVVLKFGVIAFKVLLFVGVALVVIGLWHSWHD